MSGVVAILGVGVMGGSLARALSIQGREVRVWTPDFSDAAQAGTLPGVTVAPDAGEATRGVDGVVLAGPLSTVGESLEVIAEAAPEGAWIQDVASLQRRPLDLAREVGLSERYVSAHPMVGSHRSGYAGSSDDLYLHAPVWLSHRGAASGVQAAAQRLWDTVGAECEWVDATEHDARMVLVSHLPQVVAVELARTIASRGRGVDELGPGGRDMTRLAASNPRMWTDLFAESGPEVAAALRELIERLAGMAEAVEAHEVERIRDAFVEAGAWRGE